MIQGTDTKAQHRLGVALICCATVCMASLDAVTKILADLFDPPQILLIRWVIFLSAGLALTARHRVNPRRAFVSQRPGLQIIRALVLTALSGVFVLAFKNLQLAEVIAIAASAPLIVTALSKPLLGESLGWRRWASVIVGFIGVLIILRPGFAAFNPSHLLSLVGAMMW
ncbi:MAG: DMT family transporter, partial [Thalassobaculaceae bacterium]